MPDAPSTAALIVAAGKGERMGGTLPKQYAPLAGRTVLARGIEALRAHPAIDHVQVVIGEGQQSLYASATAGLDLPPPVTGGATRRESVLRGLDAIGRAGRVLIHDAARPDIPLPVIGRLLAALDTAPAAVPVLTVADSLARGGAVLGDAVSRDGLVRVQTPQAFAFDAIRMAHDAWSGGTEATDDAQVARAAGLTVATVAGDARLEKLTYAGDMEAAAARLAPMLISRTGMGFDVHAFAPGDRVWLGGIAIPHARSLAGHSDADVALHAITDALLGALAEGDIGDHFPPTDPQWRGAPSALFLGHARDLVAARGGVIDHIDLTIICETPKVGPHRAAMRTRIAELLGLPPARISVKATTTERLGFTGRGEGIAAHAAATIRAPL